MKSCAKCGKPFTARDVIFVTEEGDYVHKSHALEDDPDYPPLGFMAGFSLESVNAIAKELDGEQESLKIELNELQKMQEWYKEREQPAPQYWKERFLKAKLKYAALQQMIDKIRNV